VSLEQSIAAARENARSIREVISLESSRASTSCTLGSIPRARLDFDEAPLRLLPPRPARDAAAAGLLRRTMLHDAPLDFIWLGGDAGADRADRPHPRRAPPRVHHRASGAAEASPVVEVSLWLSLLRACYGFESFMKSHRGAVSAQAVSSFLLWSRASPGRWALPAARARAAGADTPQNGRLPALRAQERLRVLDAGWKAPRERRSRTRSCTRR